ncbi:MAG: hypothetical protein HY277_04185, partial [Ignavibacteriales bacterium]|nr:hypothetical protein [Ignavibacteriales bacterium]
VIKVSKPPSKFSLDDLFGANLQKSGSLVRGFTIATNRDLSLNSGFRMQMSGNLTNDLELVAALTDENSPIQPEGTTQTLQEIDKVFIELRGEHVRATMGDFNLSLSGNEFGRLNRKLQGAQGLASYRAGDVQGEFLISGAVTRGKFATNQFEGLDGVQGPYRLAGQSNTRTIIVIAGTERVYVNGEKMVRGENSDYTIDYANAEVTFTPRRLISRGSRITVDFEYSDRRFTRSLLAAKSGTSFFNNQWLFNATVVRENDDENSPIDVAIADSDKVILQNAGDDASKASRSGVEVVGPGKGQYIRVDTTVVLATGGDSTITIYRYTPEDTLRAIYSVTFSLVGRGSYKKVSVGQYQFIGLYQGSYDPIRFLPLPQSHTLTDFDITGQVWENVKIMGEYALTNFDPNRFSVLDDDLHTGSAVKFSMQFSPKNIRIGGNNIGSLNLSMKERYVNSRFVALDRTNDVEFNRKWNVADSSSTDEEIREGLMTYQPIEQIAIDGGIGWIKRGELFSSKRYSLSGRLADKTIPQANYDVELIKSRNEGSGSSGHWTRQRATLQYRIGVVEPAVRYADELLANRNTISDTMITGSYRLREVVPGLSFGTAENRFANVEIGWRWDDSLAEGSLQRASRTFTHRYVAQLPEWKSFASSIDLTIQNRKFSDVFIRRRNTDGQTILLRWQTRFSPWNRGVESDWFYELATERSAKLEKIFQRVGKGTGNYVYAGDLNGNHIIDSPDFQLSRFDADFIALTVPTDELIPVIDLKASTRIRLAPALIFAPDGWVRKAVSTLSTETYLRVEEKSSEPDTRQIYLLHFSRFLNDQTTIAGSNLLTQDIYFQENRTDFFVRFRYS